MTVSYIILVRTHASRVTYYPVMFYVAPLTTLAQVVRTRDSSSLHPPLCVMNLINGTTWGSYGYFAISDPYLAAPNGIGALLGIVQCMLCVCLPRVAERERRARSQTTKG